MAASGGSDDPPWFASLPDTPAPDVGAFVAARAVPADADLRGSLAGPTEKTAALWGACQALLAREAAAGGCLGVDASKPSTITSHAPAYVHPTLDDVVVGLQTEAPLVRGVKPWGGLRLAERACAERGAELSPEIRRVFDEDDGWRRTHNQCVFSLYTPEQRAVRSSHLLTGLPDTYGRGRVMGDYRRVALYGCDALVEWKRRDRAALAADAKRPGRFFQGVGGEEPEEPEDGTLSPLSPEEPEDVPKKTSSAAASDALARRLRSLEEVSLQIDALRALVRMGASYGFDLRRPARSAREATQWTYLAFLAAVKSNDGAAISLGRLDAFLDVYIARDLETGALRGESEAQELVDHLVMKLRLVRQLRPKSYDEIFAGDPVWATLCVGGARAEAATEGVTGSRHLVTATSWRFLRSLENLGPAPEPNVTVLWDDASLPAPFAAYCAEISIATSCLQYVNDRVMRSVFDTSDYGVSCCVSGLALGRDTQYFGARCNLPKLLLYAINDGVDERSGKRVAPRFRDLAAKTGEAPSGSGSNSLEGSDDHRVFLAEPLDFSVVWSRFERYCEWLAETYVSTVNAIHHSHDLHYYEALPMALVDTRPRRACMAFGVAGLSVVADSLSAIKHCDRVTPVLTDEKPSSPPFAVGFESVGDFPAYGVDDDRADRLAVDVVQLFHRTLVAAGNRTGIYRDCEPTLSVLTITSNVMYGKHTGATPDGRAAGAPFAPGANPTHGRDDRGAISSLNSVAKVPFAGVCKDGISNTFSIAGPSLGKTREDRVANLEALLGGYFARGAQHLNVNVLTRETLIEAMNDPGKHPDLTVRVSGYAVNFNKLSVEHQREVIARTFHEAV